MAVEVLLIALVMERRKFLDPSEQQ